MGSRHRQSCPRRSGAPVSVFVAFANDAVETTHGSISKYPSSPGTTRGFCATCGSTLTCQSESRADEVHIHVGAFDAFDAFDELAPSFHIFPDERLPWLRLADPAEGA